MPKKPFEPNFHTPSEKFCKEELNKLSANMIRGNVAAEFKDTSKDDLTWETEALAKSHGIYLEFNRAKTGEEKDWMYMIRISIPGGGPLTRKQWNLMDALSEKYTKDTDGHPSIRLTTRQNIQFHWLKKGDVKNIIKTIAESGYNSLNGCGDNTRNVMACPLSRFSDIYNGHAMAQRAGDYFQLPLEPFIEVWGIDPNYLRRPEESFQYGPNLLNRKFKIAFSAVHRDDSTGKFIYDNCVEMRTHDMSVAPIVENGKVNRFQIYIGGGQGERNGKPSLATLGLPLCQIDEPRLFQVMDAVVKINQEWGDRENRWFARIKMLVKKMGIDWYRDQVSAIVGFPLQRANPNHDVGARQMHHGWTKQPSNGLWTFGAYIENGRLSDYSINGKLKTMVREVMNKYPTELMITPNQDALFTNIPESAKKDFEKDLEKYGFGKRHGKPYSRLRLNSGACVGRDTCRLTYTDSEKFEPELLDQLDAMGWGKMNESIGITGCERQCFRPATKSIGLIGTGLNRYMFKLFGDEEGRHQGRPLMNADGEALYLRSVAREKVAVVIDALFKFYKANAKPGEGLGAYHRRMGDAAIIKFLQENPATQELLGKPFPADYVIE